MAKEDKKPKQISPRKQRRRITEFVEPFRVTDGKGFRLRDYDPDDTRGVKSKEEAIEWVKRCPNPHHEDSIIEIRPVFESEDLGPGLTPELKQKEAELRAKTEAQRR